jgi:hypothetical protein
MAGRTQPPGGWGALAGNRPHTTSRSDHAAKGEGVTLYQPRFAAPHRKVMDVDRVAVFTCKGARHNGLLCEPDRAGSFWPGTPALYKTPLCYTPPHNSRRRRQHQLNSARAPLSPISLHERRRGGVAGVSHSMPCACGTVCACKRIRALQGGGFACCKRRDGAVNSASRSAVRRFWRVRCNAVCLCLILAFYRCQKRLCCVPGHLVEAWPGHGIFIVPMPR